MSSINSKDCDRPSERDLNNHVIPEVADKWKEIGIELLDSDSTKVLDIIEHDHQNDTKACCTRMFKKWLDSQEHASWKQMLTALRSRSVQLNTLANKIENMLIREASPPAASSIDFSECHDISEGLLLLTRELSKVLASANFSALKRAFKVAVPGGVQLPDDLKKKIKKAKELDTLLDALVESKYWNFADLRLVGVLVMSSGIREAKTVVDKYKEVFFSTKLVDVLNVCTHTVLPPDQHKEYVCRVGSKISKEPNEITVADLAQYCTALETVIMDINEGSCVLDHVKIGCVEIHWLIPIHCRYHAYKSALDNRHKFHSLHLQYLKIETYPVIYDQFTVQPTILSTLLCSPNPVVSTPAEVIAHYYCFLADSFSHDTFCQIMSFLELLKADDKTTLSMLPSEYQRNALLLDHLILDTNSIYRFCHTLQETKNQQQIGYMLINAIQSIPPDDDIVKSLHSERGSIQQASTTDFDEDEEPSELTSEIILAAKSVHIKFLHTTVRVNESLQNCNRQSFFEACNKLYAYVSHSKIEPLFPPNYIANLNTIQQVLMRLSFMWSWHNCSVLRTILEECNCQDGLTLLDEFESQVDLNQPIELFPIPRSSPKVTLSPSSAYTTLSVRSELCQNRQAPLQYTREVSTMLGEIFGISQNALQLLAVQPNPLVMYWMTPKSVVSLISKGIHLHTDDLKHHQFLELTAYPNITLFPRHSLQDPFTTSLEDKSIGIEQTKIANLQSELSIKMQELDKLKNNERKVAALYTQSRIEIDKMEKRLSSGIEWLASAPLKLCSEIETKLSRNITMLSNLQLKLQEKQWSIGMEKKGSTVSNDNQKGNEHTERNPSRSHRDIDRKLLYPYVIELAPHWRDLGVQLLKNKDDIRIIEKDFPNNTRKCWDEMFDEWLDGDTEASWKKLIDALKTINLFSLAEKISSDVLKGCHNRILDLIAPYFTANVNIVTLLPYLQQHNLVTRDEEHHLSVKVLSSVRKARMLLSYLKAKGDKLSLQMILCCLNLADEHSEHKDIAVKLQQIMEANNINVYDFCGEHQPLIPTINNYI